MANTTYTGKSGKEFTIGANGTVTVNNSNGTGQAHTYTTNDPNYNSMLSAMKADGIDYTPTTSWTDSGGTTYNQVNYGAGNQALQDYTAQYIKDNGLAHVTYDEVANSIINSGKSQNEIADTLNGLGLGDYVNGIYTASGKVLPNNQYVTYTNGANGVSDSFGGADKTWANYGGQSYLIGGQGANYATYANGKTGNLNNAYYLYNDPTKNSYMASDPAMMAAYNERLQQLGYNPSTWGTTNTETTTPTTGTLTGNANVDSAINLLNSANSYYTSIGNQDYLDSLASQVLKALAEGNESMKTLINNQRDKAKQESENQARQAYINNELAQSKIGEQMSALGRGTSGALQQAQLGLQTNFSNDINTINTNLMNMLSQLNDQELEMLAKYYQEAAQMQYQFGTDAWNRQQQLAEFAYKQEQDAIANEMARQEALMRQQQYDNQTLQSQAKYLGDMLDSGLIDGNTYYQEMNKLGLVGSDLTILNNSARSTGSSGSGTTKTVNNGGGLFDDVDNQYNPKIEGIKTMALGYTGDADPNQTTRYHTETQNQAQQQMADNLANQSTIRTVNGQPVREYADGSFDVVKPNGQTTHYSANFRKQYGL